MSRMTPRNADAVGSAPPKWGQCSPDEIRAQLERVLNSPLFQSSRRCQSLLRHVTERTLAGDTAALKERTVGIDVFGRPPDYDTNADPVVRGTAGEVRKKLARYYQDPPHQGEPRIDLRPGSYIPEFHSAEVVAKPELRPWQPRIALVSTAAVAVLIASAILVAHWQLSDVDRFWRPMLDAPGGVVFCLGQSRAYNFRSDARQKQIETMIESMTPAALESSREMVPLSELVPMWDRYIALGDAICLLRLTSLFERHGKPYRIRGEASTTFSDLRERPSILIGAFDNEWTLRLVGAMRYTFYKDFQGLEVVRDRQHPENTDWKLVNSWPNWDISNDYAIVSRVLDVNSGRMVVVAAGITQFGTQGAGEFLSDPRSFSEVAPSLPRDWPRRNLQIVLRVPVVHGASGHPVVLATHVW